MRNRRRFVPTVDQLGLRIAPSTFTAPTDPGCCDLSSGSTTTTTTISTTTAISLSTTTTTTS